MEKCDRCGEIDQDRRTLYMACFYAMEELGIPFKVVKLEPKTGTNIQTFFTLRVCKECRADWMKSIKDWFFNIPPAKDSCGSGIFIRRNGVAVEITEAYWNTLYPDRIPTKIKK